ncbi:non-specific lipid-transfer protein 8 [Senna tora]|uniref:Non-specific lipid-transfer protein n=1 Tax=Senna tora TaxID=362788 RepID=A0A835CBR2_9FABA|nr:non-specific lipid-transfer protein 8 [Senna tora]
MKLQVVALLLVLVLLLVPLASSSSNEITCSDVIGYLRPCEEYLTAESGSKPSESCCEGANALKSAAITQQDRIAACECIKTVAKSIKLNPQNAHDLPSNCGITLPFEISPTLDCSK